MGISVTSEGNFNKTESLLLNITKGNYMSKVDNIAKKGVAALKAATPVDTGQTRDSWSYAILQEGNGVTITWTNNRYIEGYYYTTEGRTPLVIILVYGHATKHGYVPPNDFVTPAIEATLKEITDTTWAEVNKT